ncbi:hypothetical protein V4S36_07985 [Enterococcus cecorum]|uniref:hypothetical protein n=2 Tax=Enterococcus cecorum TaxID=44008 RepID=UPI0032647DDD
MKEMDVYVICENDNGRLIDLEVYFSEQSAEEALGEYKDKQDGRIYVIKNENAMSDDFAVRRKIEFFGERTTEGQYRAFKACIREKYRQYSWILFCLRKGMLIDNKKLKKLR